MNTGKTKGVWLCFVLPLTVLSLGAYAQEGPPSYQNLRFNEDWSATPEDGYGDHFDSLKNISLGEKSTLSIGGSVRARFENWSNFGFNHLNDDAFSMYRVFVHSDWRFGEHVRVFVEGKSSNLTERNLPGGRRAALDEDELDLWNTFLELDFKIHDYKLMLRAGRQELQYGRQRLISPLDWSNNRRIFDGVRFTLSHPEKKWSLDGFWTIPVTVRVHSFNDTNDLRNFSGIHFKTKLTKKLNYETYLLYLDRDDHIAAIDMDLYTLGAHLWGALGHGLSFDVEAAYQWGNSNHRDIGAWMVATELTYRPKDVRTSPWIQIGFDYASGDDDPLDDDMGTFNQLFPLGHAFNGYIDAVGRQNIIDAHGTIGFWPVKKKLSIKADVHFFWRAEEADAVYNAGGGVLRAGGLGLVEDRTVGTEVDLTVAYKIDRHAKLVSGFSYFFAGDFIDATGSHDDISFFYTQLKYTF